LSIHGWVYGLNSGFDRFKVNISSNKELMKFTNYLKKIALGRFFFSISKFSLKADGSNFGINLFNIGNNKLPLQKNSQ
jgi:hypothetical protein